MALPQRSLGRLIDLTSNLIFFNSKAVAGEWEGIVPPTKTRVVYNWTSANSGLNKPVELSDSTARSLLEGATFVAASVGSIIPFKRHIDAVLAVGTLIREGLDVGLLIVGPALHPGAHAQLVSAITDNGWSDRIRLLGYSDAPGQVMHRADVTLVCSDSESFGRVTIESMSEGTPVVGADFGGTAEIVQAGVNGLLYPPGDVDALANRLRELVRDRDLRGRLAEGARQTGEGFRGPDRSMTPVIAALRTLIGERNPSWPLGMIVETAYSHGLASAANIPRPSLRRKAIAKIRRTIRRIW
jgi:glycosyltransferase involved in cell wall biosynthesis